MNKVRIASVIAAVAVLVVTLSVVRRARQGIHPAPDAAFQPAAIAPLWPVPTEPYQLQGFQPGRVRQGMVMFLFIDGLALEPFMSMLAAGELPVIAELLESQPSIQLAAMGTFPSSTAPSVSEILTGRWSHFQVGGADKIHSFDRRRAELVRYEVEGHAWDGNQPTLFDEVSGAGGSAISYFEGYFPGANLNVQDELSYLWDIAEDRVRARNIGAYDRKMVDDFSARLARAERAPNFVFIRFGAVDTAGHFFGPDSAEYRTAMRRTDEQVGRLLDQLRLARLPDGTSLADTATFLLFSDHGMAATRRFVDLDHRLAELGFDPWPTSSPAAVIATTIDRKGVFERDVVAVPGGSNVSMIYLRARGEVRPMAWSKTPPGLDGHAVRNGRGEEVDLLRALAETEGVDLVVGPTGPQTLRIERSPEAGATLVRYFDPVGDWAIGYVPDDPRDDPFGYCPDAPDLCCAAVPSPGDSCLHTVGEWDSATARFPLPSGPFFMFKAFSGDPSTRQDILLTAEPGAGFMQGTRGDHGAFTEELLRVPLMVIGPTVDPDAVVPHPRLIDIFPTTLDFLGLLDDAVAVDGRVMPVFRREEAAAGGG